MRLTQCKKNINMQITKIKIEANMRERLKELGFIEGASIKFLYKFNTSFAFKIKNTIIGLRKEDAEKIIVEEYMQK